MACWSALGAGPDDGDFERARLATDFWCSPPSTLFFIMVALQHMRTCDAAFKSSRVLMDLFSRHLSSWKMLLSSFGIVETILSMMFVRS